MTIFLLIQTALNLGFCLSFVILWRKFKRAPQDDPRLSRGLQLLQSKIAILEDLSDRTENQTKQLTALLEQKILSVHEKMLQAEKHNQQVEGSIQKSLEVAKIFQDKIPHKEIIERQNTVKYIKAAQLSHSGKSFEEISRLVDIPIGELQMIMKLNRKELTFSQEHLPEWAKADLTENSSAESTSPVASQIENSMTDISSSANKSGTEASESLKKLGAEFRRFQGGQS